MNNQKYLKTKDIADRYGVKPETVQSWRRKSRQTNQVIGPPWIQLPDSKTVRYDIMEVQRWEKLNS